MFSYLKNSYASYLILAVSYYYDECLMITQISMFWNVYFPQRRISLDIIVFCCTGGGGSVVAEPHGKRGALVWVSIKTNQIPSLGCSYFLCYVNMGLCHVALFRSVWISQTKRWLYWCVREKIKIEASEWVSYIILYLKITS